LGADHAFGLPDAATTDGACLSASMCDYPTCRFDQQQRQRS
jgi:hypothetical protein